MIDKRNVSLLFYLVHVNYQQYHFMSTFFRNVAYRGFATEPLGAMSTASFVSPRGGRKMHFFALCTPSAKNPES